MTFIEKLKTLLKRDGLTAKALTQELGISPTAISDWQRGKSSPSPDALIGISKKFNVSIDWLLGLSADPTPRDLTPAEREAFEKVAAKTEGFKLDDEQLADMLPANIREGILALLRLERDKWGNN